MCAQVVQQLIDVPQRVSGPREKLRFISARLGYKEVTGEFIGGYDCVRWKFHRFESRTLLVVSKPISRGQVKPGRLNQREISTSFTLCLLMRQVQVWSCSERRSSTATGHALPQWPSAIRHRRTSPSAISNTRFWNSRKVEVPRRRAMDTRFMTVISDVGPRVSC